MPQKRCTPPVSQSRTTCALHNPLSEYGMVRWRKYEPGEQLRRLKQQRQMKVEAGFQLSYYTQSSSDPVLSKQPEHVLHEPSSCRMRASKFHDSACSRYVERVTG
ncbi:hypothetical protein OnM2_071017 [Erysiphe neolycopersici]|uniref:Uncharacterized protein n=1 Tax=Erysiphe neolycopersici TaxID=212602 RepID=A0A420HKB7_9PEZI|nr:hypothetical protein OnM2_071017 [Erysiphe neolycopersici]